MGNKKKSSLSGDKRVREYSSTRKYSRPKSPKEAKSYTKRSVAHSKPKASEIQVSSTHVAKKNSQQAGGVQSLHTSASKNSASTKKHKFSLGSSIYGDYASTDPKYLPKYDLKHSSRKAVLSDNQMRVLHKNKQPKQKPRSLKAKPVVPRQPVNPSTVNLQLTPAQLAHWQHYMRAVAQTQSHAQTSMQAKTGQRQVPIAGQNNSAQAPPRTSQAKASSAVNNSKVVSIQSGDSEELRQKQLLKKQKKEQKKVQRLEKRTKKRETRKAEKARPRDRVSFSVPIPKPVSRVHRKTKSRLNALSDNTEAGAGTKRKVVMYAMASVLFAIGLSVSVNGFMTNQKVDAQIKQVAENTQSTSENKDKKPAKKPKDISKDKKNDTAVFNSYHSDNYNVPGNLPSRISIPALGVNANIIPEGVDSEGALIAPDSIYTAGWYNRSALPGNPGGMLIEGHSGIGSVHGIFRNIHKLKSGDEVTVTRGDGKQFTYTVVKQKVYGIESVDMASMMVSQDPSKPGLNMISCAGDIIPGTLDFDQRIIVYAVMK